MASHGTIPAKLEKLLAEIRDGQAPAEVDLSNCGLTELPQAIYDVRDTIEILNLGGNSLSNLPDWIQELDKVMQIRGPFSGYIFTYLHALLYDSPCTPFSSESSSLQITLSKQSLWFWGK
jgi:Leucine-rich repeat (LRR) protein